ncbi:MAG: acyl carrier protein [Acidobacteriota bacterium]|nr:acyl carrier protein [Blastocatellia bacterium]MDW8239723.1 acyl carrier protein [Acidobacteriota bacterium]
MSDVLTRFSRMVAELKGIDPSSISAESRLVEDLGADSIDLVELMLDAEREFGIDIGKQQAQSLHTIGAIVEYIEAALAKQAGSPST